MWSVLLGSQPEATPQARIGKEALYSRRYDRVVRRKGTSFEEKARAMRERNSPISALVLNPTAFSERHYSVKEVAEMWSLSPDAVRRVFADEPGVLVIGDSSSPYKRTYRTLRIPQSTLERVHRRMSRA